MQLLKQSLLPGLRNQAPVCVRQSRAVLPGPRSQRDRIRAAAHDSEDRDRLAEVEALQEAMELYKEAQELSQKQVLHELMQMQLTDMATYNEDGSITPSTSSSPSPPASASSSTSGRSASSSSRSMPGKSPAPGSTRREPAPPTAHAPPPASLSALTNFWVEQGMTIAAADRVSRQMIASQSRFLSIPLLATQLQRLQRVIPGRVEDMIARDPGLLEASPSVVAAHFVQLVQLFPGLMDVAELASKQPKLLYCDDLVGQYEAVVGKLVQLHPSHNPEEARQLLMENPDLMFRVSGYYMHVRSLDELPIDLQNLMIITGQGLHHLHQHHSKGVSPRFV